MNNITKTNLEIDLREINHILATKPNIMASEYIELCQAKKEIVKRLIKREYPIVLIVTKKTEIVTLY